MQSMAGTGDIEPVNVRAFDPGGMRSCGDLTVTQIFAIAFEAFFELHVRDRLPIKSSLTRRLGPNLKEFAYGLDNDYFVASKTACWTK